MLMPTVVMALIALALFIAVHFQKPGQDMQGMRAGLKMMIEILPLLIFAFIVAGMIQVLVPKEAINRWVGQESGFRGILIGTVVGAFTPGGPYVSMPIAAGLLRAGVGIGTMVAYITGWSLWAVARLPMEVGMMGWRFTVIRLASTFFFPPIAGWIAQRIVDGWKE